MVTVYQDRQARRPNDSRWKWKHDLARSKLQLHDLKACKRNESEDTVNVRRIALHMTLNYFEISRS